MVNDLIEMGNYAEVLELLNDFSDENTRHLRLICLNGLGEFKEAKKEALLAKQLASETYYDVVAQYLNTLKELEEYDEAIDILVEELSMPYIPYQYESLFNAVYDEILLLKQEMNYQLEAKNQIFSIEEIALLLDKDNCNDDLLYMALDQLQQLNVRLIIPSIQTFLMNPNKHSFAKSLIIESLIEQQVDEELEVYKLGVVYDFNPSYLPLVLEQSAYVGIYHLLEENLENDNPSLLTQCLDYLEFVLYTYFPKEIYDDEYNVYAGAIHYYISCLQSIDVDIEDIEIGYQCRQEEIEEKILALKQIEC